MTNITYKNEKNGILIYKEEILCILYDKLTNRVSNTLNLSLEEINECIKILNEELSKSKNK